MINMDYRIYLAKKDMYISDELYEALWNYEKTIDEFEQQQYQRIL